MATVRLGRYELEEYDLPRRCMCCGARASHYKSKKFQWSPPWAFIVLGVIGAMMFMKTATVSVPLCERHKWHWARVPVFVFIGLAVLIAWGIGGAVITSEKESLAPYIFVPLLPALLGWFIALLVLASCTIRPTEITDKSITLRGVCEEFIEALEEARRGDDDRPRRGRSRDADDEEEEEDRPRRRRARDEDDEKPRARRRAAEEEGDGGYYDPDRRRRRGREDD
ncbi:MAG TPA: hypothetical protein VKA46_03510 [Gemmataceae bacterium]|nr:hypothetical protein [Gemmataceae bacterium]